MLNCHHRICVPYEAHVYNTFWPYREAYEPLSDPKQQARLVNDVLSLRVFKDWNNPPRAQDVLARLRRPSFHGVFEALMNAWAQAQGKPRWAEKTPQNGLYWRALNEGFPHARFIHLVRDGRDCALSWINARFGPKLVYPAALRWARYVHEMEALGRTVGPQRYLPIKYEDLIRDTEQTLRNVCDFLGEPFDAKMLTYYQQDDDYMTDRRNRENLKRPVMKSNAGKWKKRMSAHDQRVFEAAAGPGLEKYGYPRRYPDASIGVWERLRILYIMHPPLRAVAMLRNTQGWIDWLIQFRLKCRLNLTPSRRYGRLVSRLYARWINKDDGKPRNTTLAHRHS
jgi:hypothetical protein